VPARRVELRHPRRRDEDEFLERARASISLHRPWGSAPVTSEQYRAYLGRLAGERHEGFLVRLRASGELVGVVNLNEIVRGSFQSAYLGYYAFTPFAGRGLMREGLRLCLAKAFGAVRLHRVEANIQPANEPSRRLVEALGFRHEGHSPRYLKIGGRWRDHERWALLAEEWRAR